MPIFCKKVISLKITHFLCPYCVKKTSLLSKTLCSYVVFVKFFVKNTLLASHIWPKKVDSITSYYGPKKSIGCPFFPISHEKISAVMPIFCQQNVHSLKTHCSYVHILSKKINSLNNKVLSYHFFFVFKFVMKNPLLSYPYFVKNVNSVKNYTMA